MFDQGLLVERCSGEMSLDMRKKTLRRFAQGEIGVLVCTDLIARGIDIITVKHVINYDLPNGEREYVHRVGRTARAGNAGSAWSLVCGQGDRKHFNTMVNKIYRQNQVLLEKPPPDNREQDDERYKEVLKQLESEVLDRAG